MEYIISILTERLAKKILANKETAISYLKKLNQIKFIPELSDLKKTTSTNDIWKLVVKYWDYDISKDIIRDLFRQTSKYNRGVDSIKAISILRKEWNDLNLV